MINIWEQLELVPVSCYYQELDKNWNSENFHLRSRLFPYSRIYFPVAGSGHMVCGKQEYRIEPGKMLLIPAFTEARLWCDSFLNKYYIHFSALAPDSKLDIFSTVRECVEINVSSENYPAVIFLFKQMAALFEGNSCVDHPRVQLAGRSALGVILSLFLDSINWRVPASEFSRFLEILLCFEKNLSREDLTLAKIAREVGMHPNYLCAYFRKRMKISPVKHLRLRRLERASELIRSTEMSSGEIANSLGVSSSRLLSQMFKHYCGRTLSETFRELRGTPNPI